VTASDLIAAVIPVAECLEALGVRYYFTGSLASSAHGVARASLDVDLVADLEASHIEALVRCLGSAYYVFLDHIRAAVNERRSFNLIHLATMFKVDVFVARRRPFDRQAADRARPEALEEGADARTLPVATPEDTVLAKLEWFRRGGETSERQWWDIVGVLKVARHADRAHLTTWADALGVADLLERALAEADQHP
jgi:hypothetical protein